MLKNKNKNNKKNSWLQRQNKDPYVKMAQELGYRSRAAFKFLEINKKYQLLKKVNSVCDIGAAPGGWSQIISLTFEEQLKRAQKEETETSKPPKSIIAIDLLDMDDLPYVHFIKGDFTHKDTLANIGITNFDLIVSDIAPNTTGHAGTDHLKSMFLASSVLEFVKLHLKTNGNFVIKIFLGAKEKDFAKEVREIFEKVEYFKPSSSRSESKEVFIIGLKKLAIKHN